MKIHDLDHHHKAEKGPEHAFLVKKAHAKTNIEINYLELMSDHELRQLIKGDELDEMAAWMRNDPEGHTIIPHGGMGSGNEATWKSISTRKLQQCIEMIQSGNYTGAEHTLYKGGFLEGAVKALARYEEFMHKQGKRRIAKGKEVELGETPFAGAAVGQKAGPAGQLRGNAKPRRDGKQPAQDKLVGGMEEDHTLDEKASAKLCASSRSNAELGASNLASCKSQGFRAREGKKSHKLGKSPKSRVVVGGHKIKGKKYGGPLPDWS